MRKLQSALRAAVVIAGLGLTRCVLAETPSTQPEIRFGMSAAFTGPSAQTGMSMRQGLLAGFERANRAGGVNGARIRLISLDDAYEPGRAGRNAKHLIETEQVLAMVGNVGTPTAISALPLCRANQTVFYAAHTGAPVLRRDPPDPLIFNIRAGYADEARAIINGLLDHGAYAPGEIAVLSQRDAYGDAGYAAILDALRLRGVGQRERVRHVRYERNTLAVEGALANLIYTEPKPRVVILVGTYAPCAKFIRMSHEVGFRPQFVGISFVGGEPLASALKDLPVKVIVTQVVPDPKTSDLQIVRQYRDDLARLDRSAEPSAGSLEGYLAARMLLCALEHSPNPTRATIGPALQRVGRDTGIDLGTSRIYFSATRHDGNNGVWLSLVTSGQCEAFEWKSLSELREGETPSW
jgi:branched-chain amino acid transport system substrate-binding protein